MAKDRMIRLGQLITVLSAAQALSTQELAYLCGAPVEIVNDDLEKLSYCFPIYSDSENDDQPGYWYYEEQDFQPAFQLTVKEAVELLDCLEEGQDDPVICSISERLIKAIVPNVENLPRINRVRRLFKGHKPPWDELQPAELLYELVGYCGNRRLDLTYKNQKGEVSRRAIDPLGLVYCWSHGAWYLVAFSPADQGYRHFRVERIEAIREIGPMPENNYQDFCLEKHFAYAWGIQVAAEKHDVVVRFYDDYNVISRVRRETQDRPQAKLEKESSRTYIYTDQVAGLSEIKVWLRSFGASAEVLEPKKLRDELIESYQRILDRYS